MKIEAASSRSGVIVVIVILQSSGPTVWRDAHRGAAAFRFRSGLPPTGQVGPSASISAW
jgi:hypothetical protein